MLVKRKNKSEAFPFVILFLINPFLGIIGTAWRIANNRKYFSWCIMLILMIALYMAAINTTKTIEGDEEQYVSMFRSVPTNGYVGTLSYLTKSGDVKEILYGTFVYIFYFLSFGSITAFIATTSFLIYFLFLYSIYKFGKEFDTPIYIIVAGIISISFFTQYFNLTAHLIRQFLATSFCFYGLSLRRTHKKLSVLFVLFSFMIHNSMAVLLLLSLIPKIDNYYSKKALLLIVILSVIFTFSFTSLAGSLLVEVGNNSVGSTMLERASQAEGLVDMSGQMNSGLVAFITIPLITFSIYGIFKKLASIAPIILNTCLLLSLFVVNLSYSPLLQYRFFYLLYSFFPFVLFIPLRKKVYLSKIYCMSLSLIMIVRFYMTYDLTWDYLPLSYALFLPYPLIFIMS